MNTDTQAQNEPPDPKQPAAASTPPATRYDPREIRARRRAEEIIERIGRRALLAGLDPLGRWLGAPLRQDSDLLPAPAIVVLGAGIRSTGVPSPTTCARVRHGVGLLQAGFADLLVLSGGARRPGRPPVARAMAVLARDLGVPENRLILEDGSSRTSENAAMVVALLRERQIDRVLLVTTDLHMCRARRCFERHGIRIHPAPAPAAVDEAPGRASLVAQALHEWVGLAYYRARGWI